MKHTNTTAVQAAGTATQAPDELTREQLKNVLEAISGRMDTLNSLLILLQQEAIEGWAPSVLVDAAQEAAATVGAMADDALGGTVNGDMRRWLYGPNFASAGREGGAA